jgi:hypothetical protein
MSAYDVPLQISRFVQDVCAGFAMVRFISISLFTFSNSRSHHDLAELEERHSPPEIRQSEIRLEEGRGGYAILAMFSYVDDTLMLVMECS